MSDGAEILAAVRDLFRGIERADIPAIHAHYLHEPRVYVFLESWESKYEGWDQARRQASWERLLGAVRFHELWLEDDAHAGQAGDLGWAAGTVQYRYSAHAPGSPIVEAWNRGTWIMERHDGRWLTVHEHVSFPAVDPYPAG